MTGQGYAARGANIFNAIEAMARRRQGQRELKEFEEKQGGLRKTIEQGRLAELGRQDTNRQQEKVFQRTLAQEARDHNAALMRGDPQVWTNDNGDELVWAMTQSGPVNPYTGERVNLEGFEPPAKGVSRYGFGQLRAKDQTLASNAFAGIRKATDIKNLAKDFTQGDVDSLNKVFQNTAIKAMTPAQFENYVQNNWKNLSPRVKKFYSKSKALGAEQRHALFGAALTKREGASAESFIVGADGLNLGDGMIRIDNYVDGLKASLGGMDDAYGSDLLNHPTVTSYQYYQAGSPQQAVPQGLSEADMNMTDEQLNAEIQQLMQQLGGQ